MILSKTVELILKENKFFPQPFSDTVAHQEPNRSIQHCLRFSAQQVTVHNTNSDTVIRYVYLPTSI